jgi:hypothetical protein
MQDPIAVYLHDHLAGAEFAVQLLRQLAEQHSGELAQFAVQLETEILEDRAVLRELAERVGASENALKEAMSWLAEKGSRFKLSREARGALGTFEALETLALGILGKLSLWHALAEVAKHDGRLLGPDYARLAHRAREQHTRVETRRLDAARATFARS